MKVIFCDYDGVVNRISPSYSTPMRTIEGVMTMAEPELVYRLNLIVDRTDAEIVLSSSWRHHPDWREIMRLSGIVKPFLDRTDIRTKIHGGHNGGSKEDGTYRRYRGNVIAAWIRDHPEITRYAILDDEGDMNEDQLSNFFQTRPEEGLTQEIAEAVEKHLSSSHAEA